MTTQRRRPTLRVLVLTVVHTPLDARIHRRQIGAMTAAGWSVTYAAPWSAFGIDPRLAGTGVTPRELPRAQGRRRLAALRAAGRLLARQGPAHDLVLLHDPELVLAAGPARHRPPTVLDVHEDLPASLIDRDWIPARLRPTARRLTQALERSAERRLGLLLAEEAYASRFRGLHPLVRNVPPLPPEPSPPGRDRIVYLGRLSRGRGAPELVELARALAGDGVRLELIGAADPDVEPMLAAARDRGLLDWPGWLPNDQALARISGALAGVSLLHDLPNYRRSLPTKIVEYLAAGLPVVTTPLPAAVRLVEEADAGRVVGFGDLAGAVRAIRELREAPERAAGMGARGRALVREAHSWDDEQVRFLDALEELARAQRAGTR